MQYHLLRKYSVFLLLPAMLFTGQLSSMAQSSANSDIKSDVKYVRIDIGHGGLHCPFLGPRFEQNVKDLAGIQNLKINSRESYATFELPAETDVSESRVKETATKVGYPGNDVRVVISDAAPEKAGLKN